ncbi:hypothetical protein G9A89_016748 [Geosiphon pyriformis]|nr:hypothetical protein G9A89_016748 [Geosiphon pyriformis]
MIWNYWFKDMSIASIQEKNVIITGACQGLGEQFAYYLAGKQVSHLVIASSNAEELPKVAKRCIDLGAQYVKQIVFDAGSQKNCELLIDSSVKFFPDATIDILILNDSICMTNDSIDFNAPQEIVASLRRVTEVNYLGYATLAHLALPYMTNDSITTISSTTSPLTITVTTSRRSNIIITSSSGDSNSSLQRAYLYDTSNSAIHQYFNRFREELRYQGLAKNLRVTICNLDEIVTLRKFMVDPKEIVEHILKGALRGEEWSIFPKIIDYISWLNVFMPEALRKLLN